MRSLQQWSFALCLAIFCTSLNQSLFAQCESYSCTSLPAPFNSNVGLVPICVNGNPTACSVAGRPGFRINGNSSGTYQFTQRFGAFTGCTLGSSTNNNPSDSLNSITIQHNSAVNTFSWTSSNAVAIEQIIVKGGPNALVYNYLGMDRNTDAQLHAPVNPATCTYYPVSSIEIVYRYQLSVTHTIRPVFTRTFQWTIAQSVTPDKWNLFNGDRGNTRYTVSLDQTGSTDGAWAAAGTIEIRNTTPFPAQIVSMTDSIRPGVIAIGNIACGTSAFTLPPGGSLNCSFSAPLPDAGSRTATLQVTTLGNVRGRTVATAFVFGAPTTLANATINVTDNNGQNRSINRDSTYSYERPLTCSNQGTYTNTATIVETNQKAAATVEIKCFSPVLTNTVNTSFDRLWEWETDIKSNQKEVVLSTGQRYKTQYTATVSNAASDQFFVNGTVTVRNPHPTRNMNLTSLSATLAGSAAAPLQCPANSIAPGNTITCTYNATAPDNAARGVTVSVNQQNYLYGVAGGATASGGSRTSISNTAIFPLTPTSETDECVQVYDDSLGHAKILDTLCAAKKSEKYEYQRYIGPYSETECDTQTAVLRTAFKTLDLKKSGAADYAIPVQVPCNTGCTLSQTYWLSHALNGTEAYDDNWSQLPDVDGDSKQEGQEEMFFSSGRTYWQILNMQLNGNSYWFLAKAYITTELNILNGANQTAVETGMATALQLFQTYTPTQVPLLPNSIRKNFVVTASLLERFNSGTIGPGNCSDESNNGSSDNKSEGSEQRSPDNAVIYFENDEAVSLDISPNPTSGKIRLHVENAPAGKARFNIFNAQGMKVQEGNLPPTDTVLELPATRFSGGWYVITVLFETGQRITEKVLVQGE
jgi:hypothetical protein